jgi:hypothetical protein
MTGMFKLFALALLVENWSPSPVYAADMEAMQ